MTRVSRSGSEKHDHLFIVKFFIGAWGFGKCDSCWRWNRVFHYWKDRP